MDIYIANVFLKYGHPNPKKTQLSPHKHREVIYGAKEQLAPEDETTPPLDSQGTKRVQGIIGALLYYAQAVDNKLLVGLSAIGSQQASATQRTNESIDQILDYCATYPSYGILCYTGESMPWTRFVPWLSRGGVVSSPRNRNSHRTNNTR